MFSRNKSKICLGLLLSFVFGLVSISWVNAATFEERLSEVGLDIVSFSNKNSISRYEVARLLNAANCEDCIQAPDWMRKTYTQMFWDNLRSIDGKDFDDVNYQAGVWNKKSYYYCVAYVWDKWYMAWYPSTSTKCRWSFCGQETITTSEFYQTVLNIVQDQIRTKYTINWSDVKKWMKWLKKNSLQMKVLNQTNIDAINNADSKQKYAQTNEEFQAWLKYCMYNLSACNFQSFGVIWAWYWPVSELNILYKEWIITLEDAEKTATFSSMKWAEAIRIFSAVYSNYANCSFNVDYDCDWITNGKDSCPYMYNPNQYDLDGDGIWNVCDDDIDWDWQKNPIWIVDDNNRIIVSLRDDKMDQNPLWDWNSWFSFFINVDIISSGSPTVVRFVPLTNGDISKIEWDFWDWKRQVSNNASKISHAFDSSGTFTVKATATSKKWNKSFAMTKVFVAVPKSENYLLTLSPRVSFKNWETEYTFTPVYSWDLDIIKWSVNNGIQESRKVTESFKTNVKDDGFYVVDARWYLQWELKVVSILTIVRNKSQYLASMSVKPWVLWDKTSVATNLVWVDRWSINYVSIDWWWAVTKSTDLVQYYTYTEPWLKTIQQDVILKNWEVLSSVATIMIQNPLLTQSYVVNVLWNRLSYNQGEKLSLWLDIYPIKTPIASLFTSYEIGHKNFLYSPDLSKTVLDFAYATAWDKLISNSVEVNRCVSLVNQGTININSVDLCQSALKNWTLSKYRCDQDKDWIPDLCDDDIDWDWQKHLVWIVSSENSDCSIDSRNINYNLFKKSLWVCSLDNCPFDANSDQQDLNNNWIGDVCEKSSFDLLNSANEKSGVEVGFALDGDIDQDGVLDSLDECPNAPWNSLNWCPDLSTQYCWVYSSCGNGVVDEWETCSTCPQDVGMCCGNGVLDRWENCQTCPIDAGECWLCWNGKIDKWETCKNCEEDVWKCTAWCGNGIVEEAENCRNCPEDVKECSAICWNGKIEEWEDCEDCNRDVKMCIKETCWDGKINKEAWEECDNGEKNGKDGKCTKMCTKHNPNNPKCGDGKIDEWENCETCPVDLWEKCVKNGEWSGELCWNGKIDKWESCDPNDLTEKSWWKYGCSNSCKQLLSDNVLCNSDYDWEVFLSLSGSDILCLRWNFSKFSYNALNFKRTRFCVNWSQSLECMATKTICGDWILGKWENCEICPKDVKDPCIDDWNGKCWDGNVDEWENCETCPKDVKDPCIDDWNGKCWDGNVDEWENCETCSEDVKDPCIDDWNGKCWDGNVDKGENCENCPEDAWDSCIGLYYPPDVPDEPENPDIPDVPRNIINDGCNMCPCEYVDFSTDLTKWDIVRAKLWDKSLSVFYRYSNSVSLETFLGF